MARPRREAFEPLHQGGDVRSGKPIVAVTALFLEFDQAAGLEFAEMRTRGLRRNAGLLREFACGQRAAAHQCGEDVGAGGIANQRGDLGNIGACFHTSIVNEAFMSSKRVYTSTRSLMPTVHERDGKET